MADELARIAQVPDQKARTEQYRSWLHKVAQAGTGASCRAFIDHSKPYNILLLPTYGSVLLIGSDFFLASCSLLWYCDLPCQQAWVHAAQLSHLTEALLKQS